MLEWFWEKSQSTGGITMDHNHSNTIEGFRKSGRYLSLDERGMIKTLHRRETTE